MPALLEFLKALAIALVPWLADLAKGWLARQEDAREEHKESRKDIGRAIRSRDADRITAAVQRRRRRLRDEAD